VLLTYLHRRGRPVGYRNLSRQHRWILGYGGGAKLGKISLLSRTLSMPWFRLEN
ncbi:unnamed protein product, partial [Ectocarpus sp. 12 AP-2014]